MTDTITWLDQEFTAEPKPQTGTTKPPSSPEAPPPPWAVRWFIDDPTWPRPVAIEVTVASERAS